MKKINLISLIITIFLQAEAYPTLSKNDNHVGTITYKADKVTDINVAHGYVSILEFDSDEVALNYGTGFNQGWDISEFDNFLQIRPKVYAGDVVIDEVADDINNTNVFQTATKKVIVEPDAEWDTNLFVQTNKRFYLINLYLTDKEDMHYKVNYTYKQNKTTSSEDKINKKLNRIAIPRNWAYYMKVNKNSSDIKPNFVYDDGTFTYIGFDKTKTMPSVFEVEDKDESIINTHVKQDGNYKVLVLHKLVKIAFLRDGKKLVGILNAGFGKNDDYNYKKTSSNVIERELIKDAE